MNGKGSQRYFNILTALLVSPGCISGLNVDQILKSFACQVEESLFYLEDNEETSGALRSLT